MACSQLHTADKAVLSRLDPVSNLQLIACSHCRRGQDKTALSRPRRWCEQAITYLLTYLQVST